MEWLAAAGLGSGHRDRFFRPGFCVALSRDILEPWGLSVRTVTSSQVGKAPALHAQAVSHCWEAPGPG